MNILLNILLRISKPLIMFTVNTTKYEAASHEKV